MERQSKNTIDWGNIAGSQCLCGLFITILFESFTPLSSTNWLTTPIRLAISLFFSISLMIFLTSLKFHLDEINRENTIEEIRRLLDEERTGNARAQPPAEK